MLWNEWNDLELQIVEMNDEVERFERRRMPDSATDPVRRTVGRDRDRPCDRQRGSLPQGMRVRCVARHCATPVLDRWQRKAPRDQQARQPVPAQDPHPWSTRSC